MKSLLTLLLCGLLLTCLAIGCGDKDAADDATAVTEQVDDAVDAAGEATEDAVDAVGEAVEDAAEAVGDAVEDAGEAVEDAADAIKKEASGE